jgi:hypothetical protein
VGGVNGGADQCEEELLRLLFDAESELRARSSRVKSESRLHMLSASSNPDNPTGMPVTKRQWGEMGADEEELTGTVRPDWGGEPAIAIERARTVSMWYAL